MSRTVFTILLMCFVSLHLYSKNEQDSVFSLLNTELNNKAVYMEKKERKINSLKELLNTQNLPEEQEYDINVKLSGEYKKYNIDSAIFYIEKNQEIAKHINNKYMIDEASLQLSLLYSASGIYIESKEILNSINRHSLDNKLLPLYFEANSQFYGHYAQSNNRHIYFQKNEAFRDSLLTILDPHSIQYQIACSERILYQGQLEIASKRLLDLIKQVAPDDPNYAIVTYLLGTAYKNKHNLELQKQYYAMSAICDIRNAIKDNASLQSLASTYYEEGNIDLAYKLTKSAIEDAVFCNVRFRTIEISEFFSIINTAYQAKEYKQKSELKVFLIFTSILILCLVVAVIYVYKQMKRVSRIRKELYRANVKLIDMNEDMTATNAQLNDANLQLSEANHIKEEYIAHFFDLCSTYVAKLEDYRKSLNKKAANNQLDELFKMLKSTTIVDNELEELYKQFDNIFLSLYPGFVEGFNSLLIKEEQVQLKQGELLNTELRIFALIRLGINDSVKIAGFLRYSLSTIYNYRTKARNKAAVSRDEFENQIMKIGTIQKIR